MPTLRFEGTIAAGGQVVNVLAGSKFEILPFPSAVTLYAAQDGAVLANGGLRADFTMGNVIEIDDAWVPTKGATVGPNRNEDMLGGGVSARHDRLQLRLNNNDAANASNYRVLIDIRPL